MRCDVIDMITGMSSPLGKDAGPDAVGRRSGPRLRVTAGCVCMLAAPLRCGLRRRFLTQSRLLKLLGRTPAFACNNAIMYRDMLRGTQGPNEAVVRVRRLYILVCLMPVYSGLFAELKQH